MIEQAYTASVMMEDLVRNILQLAKDEHEGQSSTPGQTVDPRPVVTRLVTHLRELYRDPAPDFVIGKLPLVGVSAVLVERVFYNLLVNALKFSAGTPRPRIELGAVSSTGDPVLFVRDNGVGFDARDADRLFREFTQLPGAKEGEGFGLGLALVARILRAHRGRIWAEGATGAGATFYVQLPAPESA
jgi:signal transduction histidine kinase